MSARRRLAPRREPADRGSIAIELAFLAPVILLLFGLIFAYGRVAWANGHLEAGARDAARVATQSRSMDEARRKAEAAVSESTGDVPACRNSARVQVAAADGFAPGHLVTVTVSCTYPLSDIGLPGAPGEMNPSSSFSSVIDLNRGVDE